MITSHLQTPNSKKKSFLTFHEEGFSSKKLVLRDFIFLFYMLFWVSKGKVSGHNFQDFAAKFDIQVPTTYISIGMWGFFEIQKIVHLMAFLLKNIHKKCDFFAKKIIK